MSPNHFAAIVQAECLKLLSRTAARMGLVVALLIGLLGPFALFMMNSDEAVVNGATLASTLQASAPKAALWGLYIRNLWLMQAFVVLLCALSFSGELQAHTLREDLLRPVPRWAVMLAKFASVSLFIALSLSVQYVAASALGLVFFGTEGPWRDVAFGYIASGVSDLSFAAVVFALTAMVRSVSGTVVTLLLFIVFEKLLSWALWFADGVVQSLPPEMNQLPEGITYLFQAQPMLPSAAWGLGNQVAQAEPILPLTWLAVVLYFVVGAVVAERRFAWMDVP